MEREDIGTGMIILLAIMAVVFVPLSFVRHKLSERIPKAYTVRKHILHGKSVYERLS